MNKRHDITAFVLSILPVCMLFLGLVLITNSLTGGIGFGATLTTTDLGRVLLPLGLFMLVSVPIIFISSIVYAIKAGKVQKTKKSIFRYLALTILVLEISIPVILLILDATIGI